MEIKEISTISEKETNNYWNNLSSILDIEKSIINIIEENSENIIEKETWKTKRIILDSYLTNKIFNLFWKNKSNTIKSMIKDIIKKEFILKNKDVILFSKWNIYIILSSNDKRFNWFDEENIIFVIHEFLKNFNQNNILYNVLKNIDIQNYSKKELKNFITNDYNKVIFDEYILTIQDLISEIKQDIDIEIIKWIAWKLFRDNYEVVLEELAKYFTNYILDIKTIRKITIKSIIKQIDLKNKDINFFEFNKQLTNNIKNIIKKIVKENLENKFWTWIKENFIKMIAKNINVEDIIQIIFIKISKNIIDIIEFNFKDHSVIENIELFLSYYSWKIVIENYWKLNYRFKYPELNIEWINQTNNYINTINSNNHKFIINKLVEIIKNKIKIEEQINYTKKELEKEKVEEIKKNQKKNDYQNEIKKIEEDINNKRHKMRRNIAISKKLKEELAKLNNWKLNKKIIQLMSWKKKKIEDEIEESLIMIKGYNKEISQLNYKITSLKQDLKYLEQQNKLIKKINTQIEELKNKLQIYIRKINVIKNSLSKELQKRKFKI